MDAQARQVHLHRCINRRTACFLRHIWLNAPRIHYLTVFDCHNSLVEILDQ